ncbi:hypothetical protein AB0A73_11400 [Glycomyces sp. NPDC047369]
MMYSYEPGWGWMVLMPLLWIALAGVIVWAAARLARHGGGRPHADAGPRETAREVLDRRYAAGEIGEVDYWRIREQLNGGERP